LLVGDDEIERNIRDNCARGLPQVERRPKRDGRAIICAGGPSLAAAVPQLNRGTIVAVNKASNYLIDHGVVPDYIVLADAHEVVLDQFARDKRCRYLLSSKVHPRVFDELAGYDVAIWHEYRNEPFIGHILRHYPRPMFSLYGCSVTLRAFPLLYHMGFRRIETYGWDGSFTNRHHAYDQPEDDVVYGPETLNRVRVKDREFTTRGDFAREALESLDVLGNFESLWLRGMGDKVKIKLHGDGLIPYRWRNRH
jgi:hypothetical protein